MKSKPKTGSKKVVKGWGILLYKKGEHSPYLFGINHRKYETTELFKNNGLYKRLYKIIPVEITYQHKGE